MPLRRPARDEYHPFYETYVGRLDDRPILPRLAGQPAELKALFASLRSDGAAYRYEPGKWSVRQVVGHLSDGERIFGTRAACFARGETAALPGFDQDAYVASGRFDERPVDSLVRELEALRSANLELLGGLVEEDWGRAGIASEARVSVRALAWIMAGHVDHHLAVLRERYAAAFEPAGPRLS